MVAERERSHGNGGLEAWELPSSTAAALNELSRQTSSALEVVAEAFGAALAPVRQLQRDSSPIPGYRMPEAPSLSNYEIGLQHEVQHDEQEEAHG